MPEDVKFVLTQKINNRMSTKVFTNSQDFNSALNDVQKPYVTCVAFLTPQNKCEWQWDCQKTLKNGFDSQIITGFAYKATSFAKQFFKQK